MPHVVKVAVLHALAFILCMKGTVKAVLKKDNRVTKVGFES